MESIIQFLREQQLIETAIRMILGSLVALGFVYTAGRMLNITRSDTVKNTEALVIIFMFQYLYSVVIKGMIIGPELVYDVFVHIMLTVVFYVLFCWRLYSRVDSFLDKCIGKDKDPRIKKLTKKSNKEKKNRAEDKIIIDEQNKKQAEKNRTHSEKPLHISMERFNDLPAITKGRVLKMLEKKFRTDAGVKSLREIIESGKYTNTKIQEIPKVQYNRRKYNQMNYDQQKEYEEKLKEKKTMYTITTDSGSYLEIPKSAFELINIKEKK